MFDNKCSFTCFILTIISTITFLNKAAAQPELDPWGNITGIRHKSQLFVFQSSIRVQRGNNFISTVQDHQHYQRIGEEQTVNTNLDSLFIKEEYTDEGGGEVKLVITINAHADYKFDAAYLCLELPKEYFGGGKQRLNGASDAAYRFLAAGTNYDGPATGAEFKSDERDLSIKFGSLETVRIRKDNSNTGDPQLFITLKRNGFSKGETLQSAFTIDANGEVDRKDINLTLNTHVQGRQFAGLGGNFRLQNPKYDLEVIDYCLDNIPVAFGRVELPWRYWQPMQHMDPAAAAKAGKLNPAVKNAMQMAHRLDSMGVPFILTAWFPPNWAIIGKPNMVPVKGIWGNPLNKDSLNASYKSIADYILYLKKNYRAEPIYFSFNESDLGVNVRITPQEEDNFIKGCGAYFAAHGVKTKMLLGDNSNATTWHFIDISMNDAAARPYIGAISFHSWSGYDRATLQHWADAAVKLNVPLLVGEGGYDAAAYTYPEVFQDPAYALNEINLYTRIIAICQPLSILQWQLTADYSPLVGGGIFGNNDQLHPGQRFWNLKQLASTPKGLFVMPLFVNRPDMSVAALGDNRKGIFAFHLVNTGAQRKVELEGLPESVKQLRMFITSDRLNMKDGGVVKVKHGKPKFKIEESSFTSLLSQ